MPDLVVTCPKQLWADWIREGDPAGTPESGEEWAFFLGGPRPPITQGDRLYVVSWGLLRGYAPVTRIARTDRGWAICRKGDAVAVTIARDIPGFRGFRHRWWQRENELPFPNWKTDGIPESMRRCLEGRMRA